MKRVVVTGMGGLSSIGNDWKSVSDRLRAGRNGVVVRSDWDDIDGLRTRLAAPVADLDVSGYPRKRTRSMGRDSLLSTRATELALGDAGLLESPLLGDGSTGIAYGSTSGSPAAMGVWADKLFAKRTLSGIGANEYVRMMSHTCAANIAQFFGVRGRVIPTCSACTSGSQGIGYAYEAVKYGHHPLMLGGGAEELHEIDAAVFDILYAASTRNDQPETTPRPFDVDRDGLVVSEGAATFVLEELSHARARGARIHAEVLGYATNCDGRHITNPDAEGMERVMRMGLADAGRAPEDVGYVNAHGTATEVGDIAESTAMQSVYGSRVPTSSLKSYLGHALGACGALEAWMTVEMMNAGWYAPTLNLDRIDPRCGELDYITGGVREIGADCVVSNNFAFGGVNTSLVFGPPPA